MNFGGKWSFQCGRGMVLAGGCSGRISHDGSDDDGDDGDLAVEVIGKQEEGKDAADDGREQGD